MSFESTRRARASVGALASVAIGAAVLALARSGSAERTPSGGAVHLLELEGVINPLSARYVERGLWAAAQREAKLVVLRIDTPGGLESAMRTMTTAILGSPVPVAVYVAPPGARAASAGMFVTIAGHVAAMAPGTNIGAAHPVGIGGANGESSVASTKAVNDAAALARAIADVRGRDADWAERAVRESVSADAGQALELGVVDLVAADLEALLAALDGRVVEAGGGTMTLATKDVPIESRPMSFVERVLQAITDPNIAYLLFSLGMLALMVELWNPGLFFPGLTGVVALVLAFVAFGSLPINGAGVVLLGLGLVLVIAELVTAGIGVLGPIGIVSFVLGSMILYRPIGPIGVPSPVMPDVSHSPWLAVALSLAVGGTFAFVARALLATRRVPPSTGPEAMLGRKGVAITELAPSGLVRVDSEVWSSVSDVSAAIPKGEQVEVVGVEGVMLHVAPPGLRPPKRA